MTTERTDSAEQLQPIRRVEVATPNRRTPVLEEERSNILNGMMESQAGIRNEFKSFLQSTLSVLDQDIIDRIVNVYDTHNSREDDVVTANVLMAQDLSEQSHLPFLRNFRDQVNEAFGYCSNGCAQAIKREQQAPRSILQKSLLKPGSLGSDMPSWREGDLRLIGALNDLISWGQGVRQNVLGRYRDQIALEDQAMQSPSKVPLEPLQSSPMQRFARPKSAGSGRGKRSDPRRRRRPSTAGASRSPNRRPPVGGGFRSDPSSGMNINLVVGNGIIGTGKTPGDGRSRAQVIKKAEALRQKSRLMMKNALGSYYNFEDARGGNEMLDAYNAAQEHRRRNVRNSFRAKVPKRSTAKRISEDTRELRNTTRLKKRPQSAGGLRRSTEKSSESSLDIVSHYGLRPASAHSKRPKPFDIPRKSPPSPKKMAKEAQVTHSPSKTSVLESLGVSPMPDFSVGANDAAGQAVQKDPETLEPQEVTNRGAGEGGVDQTADIQQMQGIGKNMRLEGRKRTVREMHKSKKIVLSPWASQEEETGDLAGLAAYNEGASNGPSKSRPSSASRNRPSSANRSRPSSANRSRPSSANRSRPSSASRGRSNSNAPTKLGIVGQSLPSY